MALSPLKCRYLILSFLCAGLLLQGCKGSKKIYKSSCDVDITFKHVGFSQLIDSIASYDKQYVEVTGTYKEGKGLSALFNDSLFVDHSNKNALWVNFSQDCPLYLTGTHTGLFEANDGRFISLNNKKLIIRGKVNLRSIGHKNQFKASIDRVSLVTL